MRIITFLLCCLLSVTAIAQQKQIQYSMTKEQMEVERKKIQEAIDETQQQLDAIKNDKRATMSQLRALQNKLADRQRLIGVINQQILFQRSRLTQAKTRTAQSSLCAIHPLCIRNP